MNFPEAVKSAYARYFDYRSRSSRSEFWWFFLFQILVVVALQILLPASLHVAAQNGETALIPWKYLLVIFVFMIFGYWLPNLALTARRLHDIGRSGWWQLILFVPVIGLLVFLYWMISRGADRSNRWGDPL